MSIQSYVDGDDQRDPGVASPDAAKPPAQSLNSSNVSRIASGMEGISMDQWRELQDFYRDNILPRSAESANAARAAGSQVNQLAGQAIAAGTGAQQLYDTSFRPVDQGLARQALEFSSPAYADKMATLARSDNAMQFQNAQQAMDRDMARRGVMMSPGQAVANARDLALRRAASGGALTQQARTNADQMGFERLAAAATRGGQISTAAGQARDQGAALSKVGADLNARPEQIARMNLETQQGITNNVLDNLRGSAAGYATADNASAAAALNSSNNRRETLGLIAGTIARMYGAG